MRSGPIASEEVKERLDRRDEVFPLWESGTGVLFESPWVAASGFDFRDVSALVAGAETAALALGACPASRTLLDAVLQSLAPTSRLYVYADRALEGDAAIVRKLTGDRDRVLARLGHRPPADWLIVNAGQEGRLVIGPTSDHRRWVVPVDGTLARSLFEAFRVLFWFHAAREASPDTRGDVAFRTPLAAPFPALGSNITLPSGRLCLDGDLEDPVPDAEFRTTPAFVDPGQARVLVVPPSNGLANGGMDGPVDVALPVSLAGRGHRVVWVDTGLPRTTVTRQRMVLDLVEAPIALQLEWPRAAAVDFFHRFERAAKRPLWEFHRARRLGDVRGQVLLDGSTEPEGVVPTVSVDAGHVEASLLDFEAARPVRLPDVPRLALEATFVWRRAPVALPPGARPAEVVRRWIAVDEWAARKVDSLRAAIAEMEDQEGVLSRLRRWLPSRDAAVLERRRVREELDELGESRPSDAPEQAKGRLERLTQIGARLDELRRTAHAHRQVAEEARAEESQRAAWDERIREAKAKLEDARKKLAANEEGQGRAVEARRSAQAELDDVVSSRRKQRFSALDAERAGLIAELAAARNHRKAVHGKGKGQASKSGRKEASQRLQQAEQAIARNERDRSGIDKWSPPEAELGDVAVRLGDARRLVADIEQEARRLTSEIATLERAVSEEFRFREPPRLSAPIVRDAAVPPPVPAEAPPELGELHEHRGRRYLAIRTWDQLRRAAPVASRLKAELVVAGQPKRL